MTGFPAGLSQQGKRCWQAATTWHGSRKDGERPMESFSVSILESAEFWRECAFL
jgi:hypothetical protein